MLKIINISLGTKKNKAKKQFIKMRKMFDLKKFREILEHSKIPNNMINRGIISLGDFLKPMEILLTQNKPPDHGWSDKQIKFFLELLAQMDTNNDINAFQIGEREARISTEMLYDLSAGFIHGIGRSGDIKASQPKATGASIINHLTDSMVLFFLKEMGLKNINGSIVLPLGTGMSIMLAIRGLWEYNLVQNNTSSNKNILKKNEIIVPRMDHKSPLKGIELAGFKVKQVESKFGKDYLEELLKLNDEKSTKHEIERIEKFGNEAVYVPIKDIEKAINEDTFAILSTTSFFPPRAPDNVKEIAKIAKKHKLIHIVNNAYGVQSEIIMKLLRSAIDAGHIDVIIQSTDKNFLTPVGGAIIASPSIEKLETIATMYAGRATSAPIIQLFVSLLSMGINGYKKQTKIQNENIKLLEKLLNELANKTNERILDVNNPIAKIFSLNNLSNKEIEKLGGYIYNLRVTGPRVINPQIKKFGPSNNNYPFPYIVMNSAIGSTKKDIIGAVQQLEKAINQVKKNN